MHALRSHPFFAPINWRTLWTDPAPPLEAGLVKREAPQSSNVSIRLAWDELDGDENAVDDDEAEDDLEDTSSWISHGEGQEYNFSPPGTTFEREDWMVPAEGVTHLRLWIKPDKGGKPCRATLTSLALR